MKTTVRFEHVSKQYNLGVSRTSFLKSLTNSLSALRKPADNDASEKKVLWALRDISFDLAEGESLGLIGRNGAGKSTLLKLLANITRPTAGNIEINGRVSALIELGSGFHPDLTGRENVFLNGTILGLKRNEIQRRFDEIVAFSEIEQFIDTPVKRYSSGMLVRLGFAVASCIEPDVLLVDEVLAVGDASFRQKCLGRIQSLLNRGTSIIFVSHNINMVQAVCSSSLYIQQGQIVYRGETAGAISAYERDLHEERAEAFVQSATSKREATASGVRITQVEVADAHNAQAEEFSSRQSVAIRLHYQSQQTVETANVVLRIMRTDGLTCCMMRTSVDNVPLTLQEGGGVISVVLEPLQLIGGTYFVEARITTELDLVMLATRQSDWFYVAGAPLSFEERSGVYEPIRNWLHTTDVEQMSTAYADIKVNGNGTAAQSLVKY